MNILTRCFVLALLLVLLGCNKKVSTEAGEKTSAHKTIGRYLYKDKSHTLHASTSCFILFCADSIMTNGVKYLDTCCVSPQDIEWICPHCIDEVSYAHIVAITKRNEVKPPAY